METKEYWSEVRCTYNNEEGYWCVDAYKTDDPDECGEVIAAIHEDTGDVFYIDQLARYSANAQEVIKEKVAEIKKEYAHKQGKIGETIAMLTSQIWSEVYDKMREPDCTQLSCAIRDAAYKFEEQWEATPEEERDGYYIDMIDAFAEKTIAEFKDLYC